VIGRAVLLLAIAAELADPKQEVVSHGFTFRRPGWKIFDDLFIPITRDRAGVVAGGVLAQKGMLVLLGLGPTDFAESAAGHSGLALQ
jgi:hypothetical protein